MTNTMCDQAYLIPGAPTTFNCDRESQHPGDHREVFNDQEDRLVTITWEAKLGDRNWPV